MKTSTHRYLIVAAAAALSLTLASCSGDEGNEEPTSPEQGAEETDGGEATEETTTEEVAASGPECLIGTWEITPEALEEQALAAFGGEGDVSVEGSSTLTFDEANYIVETDSSADISVELEGVAIETSTVSAGTFTIGYTADEESFTFGEVVEAEGSVTSTINGESQEVPFADAGEILAGTSQTYTCSEAELTVVTTAPGSEIEIPQTYTRA